ATAPTQVVSRKLRIGILPCDSATGVRRESTRSAGRPPVRWEDFRQRVTAQRRRREHSRPAWLARIRQDSRYTAVLEAGSRKKPIPATNRPQPKTFNTSFSAQALVEMK